ncbi:NAD-dependent epimerase/dehydratase family protein [Ensifer aridi]|uniref:NAD-dependent epimerase/dehydratase family protein n=1 Tax=Ensifer aridi TaxID=1708715 RepID=UPI00097C8529|nr:NAD(P)-dependent oxidoreductase [Ensifer aridi]
MKVFVTGGSGFLAQQFIKMALAEGHEIRSFDIAEPKEDHGEEWISGDITDSEALETALQVHKPDTVVHLATVLTDVCANDPGRGTRVNCLGTANAFHAAYKTGVGRVIYASSVSALVPEGCDIKGDGRPLGPVSPYGATKACVFR